VIASVGETITERAGVVNLSLDGSIILSAMVGFVAGVVTQNAVLASLVAQGWSQQAAMASAAGYGALAGLGAAMLVGALIALIIAVGGIALRQDQIAIGFVLTLLATDLATFVGQEYTRIPGPQILRSAMDGIINFPVLGPTLYSVFEWLRNIPNLGTIFFNQSPLVYFSYILVFGTWFWLFRTRTGLAHRAIGERPEAAFARGTDVNRLRYGYTAAGGALVGLAGAAYSLSVKPGWATPPTMLGDGWIALAIVIFGGWHPFRVVLGAYLFAGLRALSSAVQRSDLGIPVVLLNGIPWVLMIVTLLLVSSGSVERLLRVLPRPLQKRARAFLQSDPPAALGTRFEPE
jgi:simple sugar transport system permease protein